MGLLIVKLLYFIGFGLQMIGGYLLYKNSFPPNIDEFNEGGKLYDGPPNKEQLEKHNEYLKRSKLGFKLLFIGFLLQVLLNINTCFLET